MTSIEFVVVIALVAGYSLVSERAAARSVTMPMVMVGAGWLLAATDVVEARLEREAIVVIAEVTLAVILFGDAVRVDPRRLRRHLGTPARLLLIGLPLSIVVGTLVGSVVLAGATVAQAALLASILAPTDAALGAAVVEDTSVPAVDRLALNVESGVNDGLALPAVAVFTAFVLDESRSVGEWTVFVLEQVGLGAVVGMLLGGVVIRLLCLAHVKGWSDGRYEQLLTFLVPILALLIAEEVGGNSFIAAFVAGITFGAGGVMPTPSHETGRAAHFAEFTEDAAQLLAVVAFFLFGNVFLETVVSEIDARSVVVALASLTVVRMLPVWIALTGSGAPWQTRLFMGWFGPRGLASIVFGLLLLEETEAAGEGAGELFAVIALTVIGSVLLHGVSAAPGARRYGAWAASVGRGADTDERQEEMLPPTRWS